MLLFTKKCGTKKNFVNNSQLSVTIFRSFRTFAFPITLRPPLNHAERHEPRLDKCFTSSSAIDRGQCKPTSIILMVCPF